MIDFFCVDKILRREERRVGVKYKGKKGGVVYCNNIIWQVAINNLGRLLLFLLYLNTIHLQMFS